VLRAQAVAGTDHPCLAVAWTVPPPLGVAPALVTTASRPDHTTIPPETT
jgi:hypothetical protein